MPWHVCVTLQREIPLPVPAEVACPQHEVGWIPVEGRGGHGVHLSSL